MSVTKQQPYEPLTTSELDKVQKAIKNEAPELMVRAISQLRNQERLQQVEKMYQSIIHKSSSDILRDIADDIENQINNED